MAWEAYFVPIDLLETVIGNLLMGEEARAEQNCQGTLRTYILRKE